MPYLSIARCFQPRIHVSRVAARRFLQRGASSDNSQRIYIVSDSPTAHFIAHSLRDQVKSPQVTLVLNTTDRLAKWRQSPGFLALHNDEYGDCIRQNVDFELARLRYRSHGRFITPEERNAPMWKPHYDAKPPWQQLPDEPAAPDRNNLEPIEHLIVTESPQFVVPHLLALKHRLGQHSTVLLVTGNLGLMEEIIVKVFPIPSERPKFMLGEFTHQIKRPNRSREHGHGVGFQMLHHHIGNLFFTQTPLFSTNSSSRETLNQIGQEEPSQQTEYLTKTLLSAPRLSALELPPLDLHMRQLDAVAWRSVIRPLSAMMDAPNGALLSNFHLTRTMRLILAETSLVIRSLPELRGHPNAETRYGPDRLEALIKTRLLNDYHADSRTTIDVRQGVKTDIEYINGYICARAQQLGLKPFMNFMMQELVKGKSAMIRQQNNGVVEDIADVLVDEV